MTDVLLRREFGLRHRGEGHVGMEAAISQGPPGATRSWRRARKDPLLEPAEGAWPHCHLEVRLQVSRTGSECISVVIAPQFVVLCYGGPGKLSQHLINISSVSK